MADYKRICKRCGRIDIFTDSTVFPHLSTKFTDKTKPNPYCRKCYNTNFGIDLRNIPFNKEATQ